MWFERGSLQINQGLRVGVYNFSKRTKKLLSSGHTKKKCGEKDVGYDVQMTCDSWFCVVPSGVFGLAR